MGLVDYRLEANSCRPSVWIFLRGAFVFQIINTIIDGGEEKGMTKVLIEFSEWVLWVVGDGVCTKIE